MQSIRLNKKVYVGLSLVLIFLLAFFLSSKINWKSQFATAFDSSTSGNWNDPATWGVTPLALSSPTGIAFSPSGYIYVGDGSNARIVVFNQDGTASTTYTSIPFSPHDFGFPENGIAISSTTGEIYIPDTNNNRIIVLNRDGTALTTYDGDTFAPIQPRGIALAPNGELYITDNNNARVVVLNPDGTASTSYSDLTPLSTSTFGTIVGIARSSSGNIYVVDQSNQRIVVLNPDGTASTSITDLTPLSPSTFGSNMVGITISDSGYIYVADNDRIVVLNPDGTASTSYSDLTPLSPSTFSEAYSIAISPFGGNIYVSDASDNSIVILSATGTPITKIAQVILPGTDYPGESDNTIINTGTITLTRDENIHNLTLATGGTLDLNGHTLNVSGDWNNTGGTLLSNGGTVKLTGLGAQTILGTTIFENLTKISSTPSSLLFDQNATTTITKTLTLAGLSGNLLSIGSVGANSGPYLSQFGTSGTGNGQFDAPSGVAIDSSGNIFVVDTFNNRVQKFNSSGVYQSQFGTSGSGNGQFDTPTAIVIDPSNNMYVLDSNNSRVEKFDSSGVYQLKFGSSGSGDGQFDGVQFSSMALDSQGNIFITDQEARRVEKFNSLGVYQSQFGTSGTGNGEFVYPTGIAIDQYDNIYISDEGSGRVQKFDSSGIYQSQFSSQGSGDGQLYFPDGYLGFDATGNLYIVDQNNYRVEKFAPNGAYLSQFGSSGSGDGEFSGPVGIAIDPSGHVYVVDSDNNRVEKFDPGVTSTFNIIGPTGTLPIQFTGSNGTSGSGDGQLNGPYGLAQDSLGNIYIGDTQNKRVQKFDSNGNFVLKFGTPGSGDAQFGANGPQGLAVDSSNNVYVADGDNNRIQKFDSSGNFLLTFGTAGSGDGQFNFPQGVFVDSSGNIYVADTNNNRIQKFDSSGNFLLTFGTAGSGDGQFSINSPISVTVDSLGNIYAADFNASRVEKFDSSGNFLLKWGTFGTGNGQFQTPTGLAIDSTGNVYVTDNNSAGSNQIQKFDSLGNYIASFGTFGSGPGQFAFPGEIVIATDSSGHIFVADYNNNRFQTLTATPVTANLSYLSVINSVNLTASAFDCTNGCVNRGGNTNWIFPAIVYPVYHHHGGYTYPTTSQYMASSTATSTPTSTPPIATTTPPIATSTPPYCFDTALPPTSAMYGLYKPEYIDSFVVPYVKNIQNFLNNHGYTVTDPGGETGYYGASTTAAIKAFQSAYISTSSPNGLDNGTGYFGPLTHRKMNEVLGCPAIPTISIGFCFRVTLPPLQIIRSIGSVLTTTFTQEIKHIQIFLNMLGYQVTVPGTETGTLTSSTTAAISKFEHDNAAYLLDPVKIIPGPFGIGLWSVLDLTRANDMLDCSIGGTIINITTLVPASTSTIPVIPPTLPISSTTLSVPPTPTTTTPVTPVTPTSTSPISPTLPSTPTTQTQPTILSTLTSFFSNIPLPSVVTNITSNLTLPAFIPTSLSLSSFIPANAQQFIVGFTESIKGSYAQVNVVLQNLSGQLATLFANPTTSLVAKIISTIGIVTGASALISTIAFANPITFSEIGLIPSRILGLLLGALGVKRKNRPWGTVYDSVTKRPLDPVYVNLVDTKTGKEVAQAVTDLDGRYSFLAVPGTYKIVAQKTNYLPSTKMVGKMFDEVYNDLYFGEEITIATVGQIITKNIPMDSQTFDWNEFAKNRMHVNAFIKSKTIAWARVAKAFFFIGAVISLLALLFAPTPYNIIIAGFYVFVYVLNYFILGNKKLGTLKDHTTNLPLSFAIIKIFREGETEPFTKKITDTFGEYYALVPKGNYYLRIEKKNDDQTYTEIFQSPVASIQNGVINESLVL